MTQKGHDILRTVSLFSGCGGSDYGAKMAGADIVFANDIDPHAAETYRQHKELLASNDVDFQEGDIRDIRSFPGCDLLIGCYPCQSFTMGGRREPAADPRSDLYREFLRCLKSTQPRYFIVENVAGMKWLEEGKYLEAQLSSFSKAGKGYRVSVGILDAKDYGVPADRKRLFLVGVRKDLFAWYHFPRPSHGPRSDNGTPHVSHGDKIAHLPLDGSGEYYQQGTEEFSWWYMSRNRRRHWEEPSLTIVANWRHVPLHPASPRLSLAESDLENGSYQRWEFTEEYDVPDGRPVLERPRRLTWAECAALQSFPGGLEPTGPLPAKHAQVGNAVPPLLMRAIVSGLASGDALSDERPQGAIGPRFYRRVDRTQP